MIAPNVSLLESCRRPGINARDYRRDGQTRWNTTSVCSARKSSHARQTLGEDGHLPDVEHVERP